MGEDAGLGKVVGGAGGATSVVRVFQIGAILEVCAREFFELGHRCWDSTLGVGEGKFWGGQAGLLKRCVRIEKSYLPGMSDRGADRRIQSLPEQGIIYENSSKLRILPLNLKGMQAGVHRMMCGV